MRQRDNCWPIKAMYDALTALNSIGQVQLLKLRSRTGVLAAIDRYSEIAKEAADPRVRYIAQQFLPLANQNRASIEASPLFSSPSAAR
jgi:hypothetical protein